MNRCWLLIMAFAAMLAFSPAHAASKHDDGETSPAAKAAGLGGVPDFGSDITIKEMTFQELNYEGDVLTLTGPVKIEAEQFNLKNAQTVVFNKKKNTLVATGSPVEIYSPDDGITARGKRAEYDTKSKKMTLYGDPATVVQVQPEKRAVLSSDIISFVQGEGKSQALNARRRPGSKTQPVYREFPNKAPEKKKTAEPARKVNSNNIGTLLSAPQPDTGS
ncbi:LptA/OstA family protein [bacterium]|nr:LptA/OstA family protein [bacterium]